MHANVSEIASSADHRSGARISMQAKASTDRIVVGLPLLALSVLGRVCARVRVRYDASSPLPLVSNCTHICFCCCIHCTHIICQRKKQLCKLYCNTYHCSYICSFIKLLVGFESL